MKYDFNCKKFFKNFYLKNIYSFGKLSFYKDNSYEKNSNKFSLKIFLFTTLLFNPLANASYLFSPLAKVSLPDKCFKLFKTKSTVYSLHSPLQNTYSKKIFEQVYQQLHLIEGTELSQKETQIYILQLEQLIQLLEKNSEQTQKRIKLLDSNLTPALQQLPNIISFIKNESAKHESLDTQTILRLTLSTFSLHLYTYLSKPNSKSLDWARLRVILESIASFKDGQQAFSLYKIYRSVREKYSIQEYINCK